MIRSHYWFSCMVVSAVLVGLGNLAAAEDVRTLSPNVKDGDWNTYYDLSADGELLEIDYMAHRSRRLGRLATSDIPCNAIVTGCYLTDASMAYLWAGEPGERRARLWLLDVTARTTQQTDVLMVVGGDSVAVPVARDTLYLRDYEEDTSRVLSPLSGTQPKSFSFELREETPVSVSEDGKHLFVGDRTPTSHVSKVCVESGAVLEGIPAESFRVAGCDDKVFGYACIQGSYAVVSSHSGSRRGIQMQLVNLSTGSVEACSRRIAPSPSGFWRNVLVRTGSGHTLYKIGVGTGHLVGALPTGVVRGYWIRNGGFEDLPTITYDPSEKIFLLASSGAPVLADRTKFDYISMIEARLCSKWTNFDSWDAREAYFDQVRSGVTDLCGDPTRWNMEGRAPLLKQE